MKKRHTVVLSGLSVLSLAWADSLFYGNGDNHGDKSRDNPLISVSGKNRSLPDRIKTPIPSPFSAHRPAEGAVMLAFRQGQGIAGTCVPSGPEVCDGIDNDCNGIVDDDAIDAVLWCEDLDVDGYGSDLNTLMQCDQPPGYTDICGDCADFDPEMHPGAPEICDFIDNNCDGQIDENPVDGITWCRDADFDGFGDPGDTRFACAEPTPQGYVLDCSDCDDSDAGIGPCPDLIFAHSFEPG